MLCPAAKPVRRNINLCYCTAGLKPLIVATEFSFIKKSELAQKGTWVNFSTDFSMFLREKYGWNTFSTGHFLLICIRALI